MWTSRNAFPEVLKDLFLVKYGIFPRLQLLALLSSSPTTPGCLCERSHHTEASCPPTHILHSWLGGCQADSCHSVLPQLQPSLQGLVLDFSSLISSKRGSSCLEAATITSRRPQPRPDALFPSKASHASLSPVLLVVLSLLFYFCFHDTHSQAGFNL